MLIIAASFLIARAGGGYGSLAALVVAAVLLDAAVQGNQVVSQRIIYALGARARSRLNGLYIAIFFLGGAFGSAISSLSFQTGGWERVCEVGFALPILALIMFATEFVGRRT